MRTITLFGRAVWPWPARQRPRHRAEAPADTRSLMRRWEDGPDLPPAPPIGSMLRLAELQYREDAARAFGLRDDAGEHYSTQLFPALAAPAGPGCLTGNVVEDQAALAHFCPRCEAPDDGPHYEGCPFYDPDEAALFAVHLDGLEPIVVRARNLDPDAWRPYLTAAEFAESFPGVPYDQAGDDGPHTGDLAAIDYRHAEQLADRDAEVGDWLAQRATAHADLRARLIMAWQAIWQRPL